MPSKPKPIQWESWIRIKCNECGFWFMMPARDMPKTLRCPLCKNVMKTKKLKKEWLEYARRAKPKEEILE